MFVKILLATLAAAAVMAAVKDGRVLEEAGLTGSCAYVATPTGETGAWHACRAGRLDGRPDMSRHHCDPRGTVAEIEYWRCPVRVGNDARG
jgi:hypothetical protein